jgi:hypothetical protein
MAPKPSNNRKLKKAAVAAGALGAAALVRSASPKRRSAKKKSPKRRSASPKRRSAKKKSPKRRSASPKRRSAKKKSPKRRSASPKRRSTSPKRRSAKKKSPKRRSAKKKSPKRRSTKKKSPKRRSTKKKSQKRKIAAAALGAAGLAKALSLRSKTLKNGPILLKVGEYVNINEKTIPIRTFKKTLSNLRDDESRRNELNSKYIVKMINVILTEEVLALLTKSKAFSDDTMDRLQNLINKKGDPLIIYEDFLFTISFLKDQYREIPPLLEVPLPPKVPDSTKDYTAINKYITDSDNYMNKVLNAISRIKEIIKDYKIEEKMYNEYALIGTQYKAWRISYR